MTSPYRQRRSAPTDEVRLRLSPVGLVSSMFLSANLAIVTVAAIAHPGGQLLRVAPLLIVLAVLAQVPLALSWLRAPVAVRFAQHGLIVVWRFGRSSALVPYASIPAPCPEAQGVRVTETLRIDGLLTHVSSVEDVLTRLRDRLDTDARCRLAEQPTVHTHATEELVKVSLSPPSWSAPLVAGLPFLVAAASILGSWWPVAALAPVAALGTFLRLNVPRAIAVHAGELVLHFHGDSRSCRPLHPLAVSVTCRRVSIGALTIPRRAIADGDLERLRDAMSEALGRDVGEPLCSCADAQWVALA